jgi:hypothetical protein
VHRIRVKDCIAAGKVLIQIQYSPVLVCSIRVKDGRTVRCTNIPSVCGYSIWVKNGITVRCTNIPAVCVCSMRVK